MTSTKHGAVQQIKKSANNAIHSPCSNHSLNLSISKSSNAQSVRNSMGIIQDVISFFNKSSKRGFILKNTLKGQNRTLTSLCETRWIERHDSVIQFQICLPEIIESLEAISEWNDLTSSTKSKILLTAMCNCEFLITLYTVSNILSIILPASRGLQGVEQDVVAAFNCIKSVIKNLNEKINNCEDVFKGIFKEDKNAMEKLDIEIKLPRTTNKQRNRANTPADSSEQYYLRTLFIPLTEKILEDLRERFINKKK